MKYLKINQTDYPITPGESWWIVHPNQGNCEFCAPVGAYAACICDFHHFGCGVVYEVLAVENKTGSITIGADACVTEMPFYIFARYFDAEAFVRGIPTAEETEKMASAKPFDYLPTLEMEKHHG